MSIVVVGLSHHTSPVSVRETFAFSQSEIPAALAALREEEIVREGVILSTCNRVEIYAATGRDSTEGLRYLKRFLIKHRGDQEPVHEEIYELSGIQSIIHLFKVAGGLDSMVLGETEILGQLKQAYKLAFKHHHTGSRLNKTFQKAFNVGKLIRSKTNIQKGSTSVASVAVELAEKIFDGLQQRQVMVLGAGDTSEKTARALRSRGAKGILVSNRSYERAVELARQLNGEAIRFDRWDHVIPQIDIVISSTSAPHYVMTRETLTSGAGKRRSQPLLLIDIAVPRDVDPEVAFLNDVFLYNVDDLQAIANNYLQQRRKEIRRCESMIHQKALEIASILDPPEVEAPSQFALRRPTH